MHYNLATMQKLIYQKIWIIPVLTFVTAVVLINPFGHYAVNDDWDFYTHVRNFRQGDFIKNQLIDSSFILQGFAATAWTYVFGFNYNSLRCLTILVTIGFIYGLVRMMLELGIRKKLIVVGSFMILFNPFVLISALSFMTEMYFLFFLVWSLYFLIKYLKIHTDRYLLLSVLFASLSLLVRQIGFLLIPGVLICAFWSDVKNKSINWKNYIYSLGMTAISSVVVLIWPQYTSDQAHALTFLQTAVRSLNNIVGLPNILYFSIPYIGFILFPVGIGVFAKLPLKYKLLVLLASVYLFQSFYRMDIFKLGNVLYPEAFMIKNNYIHHLTLFDNIIFKVFLNFICLVSFFAVISGLFATRKSSKALLSGSFLVLTAILLIPVLMYKGFFDRYLINGLVVLVIFVLYWYSCLPNSEKVINFKLSYIFLALYCLYGIFLEQDFVVTTKTKWIQAEKLKQVKDVGNRIFLNDTYTRFYHVFSKSNNAQLTTDIPRGINYQCYIQEQTELGADNPIYKLIYGVETNRRVNKNFTNPGVFGEKTLPGYRPPTMDTRKIISRVQLTPWVESMVGNKTFIVTYCEY